MFFLTKSNIGTWRMYTKEKVRFNDPSKGNFEDVAMGN